METDRLRRDLLTSVRLTVTRERRLAGGAVVALVAYVLWVVLSGAVLLAGSGISGPGLGFDPWTTTATLAVAVGAALWVLAPAGLATYLLVRELTVERGTIAHYYRVQFPLVLVAVPLVAVGLLAGLGLALGRMPGPMLVVLVAVAWFLTIRTLAYSYRVFSLSAPRAVQAFVFESACVLAATLLAVLADAFGRAGAVTHVADAIDAALGTSGVSALVSGTVTLGGVTLPGLPALAAGFPVLLAVSYVVVQVGVGLVARVRAETVPRSQLRTGQRYPAFARPNARPTDRRQTYATSTGSRGERARSATSEGSASNTDDSDGPTGSGAQVEDSATVGSGEAADGGDHPNHTKVFSAPDDTDFEGEADASASDVADQWTWGHSEGDDDREFQSGDGDGQAFQSGDGDGQAFQSGDGDGQAFQSGDGDDYECRSCGETFSGRTNFAYCPTCGTELDPA